MVHRPCLSGQHENKEAFVSIEMDIQSCMIQMTLEVSPEKTSKLLVACHSGSGAPLEMLTVDISVRIEGNQS